MRNFTGIFYVRVRQGGPNTRGGMRENDEGRRGEGEERRRGRKSKRKGRRVRWDGRRVEGRDEGRLMKMRRLRTFSREISIESGRGMLRYG